MTFLVIAALLVLGAVLFFVWVIRSMLRAACPVCLENEDEEMVIPLLPGFRWFCPACGGAFRNEEVLQAGEKIQK